MSITVAVVVGAVALFIYTVLYTIKKGTKQLERQNYPPGPKPLPIVGNLFEMRQKHLLKNIEQWARQYRECNMTTIFGYKLVFLNDANLIRKAFASDETADKLNDRPKLFAGRILKYRDILFSKYDQDLIEMRKILHRALNLYGDGIEEFESAAQNEINHLIEKIEKREGRDINLKKLLKTSMINLLSVLLSGEQFEDGDPDSEMFYDFFQEMAELTRLPTNSILMVFPFLVKVPGQFGNLYKKAISLKEKIIEKFYREKLRTYKPGQVRGIVDVLISIHLEQKSTGTVSFTEETIQYLILDIVSAGLVTSYQTLNSYFLTLVNLPEHQKAVQSEIDDVVGGRLPVLCDRSKLPLSQATIFEVFRYSSSIPISMPHLCSEDVVLNGYRIDKGSWLIGNNWGIHHDPCVYDNPWTFQPSRFLNSEGILLSPHHPVRQGLLPFSYGKRSCPGESFSKTRMFLYTTNLLQKFEFLPSLKEKLPSHDPHTFTMASVLEPPDYLCRAVRRK